MLVISSYTYILGVTDGALNNFADIPDKTWFIQIIFRYNNNKNTFIFKKLLNQLFRNSFEYLIRVIRLSAIYIKYHQAHIYYFKNITMWLLQIND